MEEQDKSELPEEAVETSLEGEVMDEQEETAADAAAAGEAPSYEDLLEALKQSQAQAQEAHDQMLRIKAEGENLKRRTTQEVDKARKFALEKFVGDLLPVVDSMELALVAASDSGTDVDRFREGSELTMKQMLSVLEKHSLERVDPTGEAFNPELHQAMTLQESADHEPNTVMHVMQKGYVLNGRVVRPAMVVVSKKPAEPKPDTPSIDETA